MKLLSWIALSLLVSICPPAARAEEPARPAPEPKYEMTTYWVGLLYRGPAWTPEETPETRKIQEGHMANIRAMAESGKLLLAGPFSDGGNLRGMFVFKVDSLAEAKALVDQDPAVKAGRLVVELHPWFSAKGIQIVQPATSPTTAPAPGGAP